MRRTIHDLEIKNLLRMANEAMDRAYAPYSGYRVGACLKGVSGAYYLGCNVENASYSATNCAERTAVYKAISEAEKRFEAVAIISTGDQPTVPCGTCLQVLSEFCDPDIPVICASRNGRYQLYALEELLPHPFTGRDVK